MELATLLTMIFTLGVVWGGCIFVVLLAMKRERIKKDNEK